MAFPPLLEPLRCVEKVTLSLSLPETQVAYAVGGSILNDVPLRCQKEGIGGAGPCQNGGQDSRSEEVFRLLFHVLIEGRAQVEIQENAVTFINHIEFVHWV